MQPIELFESIEKTSYSQAQRPIIIDMLLNSFCSKISTIFLFPQKNEWGENETIYLVAHELPVMFKAKIFNVSMYIFFPVAFPAQPPDIYFQAKPELVVNKHYSINIINTRNLQLNSSVISKNWDPSKVDMDSKLRILQEMFSINFPLNKVPNSKEIFTGPCSIHLSQLQRVVTGGEGVSNNSNTNTNTNTTTKPITKPINNINTNVNKNNNTTNQSYHPSFNNNNNIMMPSVPPINNTAKSAIYEVKPPRELTEADINGFLLKEINYKLDFVIPDQLIQLQQDKDQLIYLKSYYNNKINSDPDGSKLTMSVSSIDNLKNTYQNEEKNLREQCAILESSKDRDINFDDIKDLVEVNLDDQLKATCIEYTLEEHLLLVKKSFEKGKLPFDEAMKEIRKTTRELFFIRQYQKKEGDEYIP